MKVYDLVCLYMKATLENNEDKTLRGLKLPLELSFYSKEMNKECCYSHTN